MGEDELDQVWARFRQVGTDLGSQLRQVDVEKDMEVGRGDEGSTLSTGTPESGSEPEMIPAPGSPTLSGQLPSPHVSSDTRQHPICLSLLFVRKTLVISGSVL